MTWLSSLLTLALAGSSAAWRLPVSVSGEKDGLHDRRDLDELKAGMHGSTFASPLLRRDSTLLSNYSACAAPVDIPGKAPKVNIWDGLTNDEAKGLLTWLHAPAQGLNLTNFANKTLWDNYVEVIESVMPNKTAALNYIDDDGELPTKYARVVIVVGATEDPYKEDFIVGPIPVTPETKINPLTYPYNKGTSKMRNPRHDNSERTKFRNKLCETISDITLDLLGTYINGTNSSLSTSSLQAVDPLQDEDGRIVEWVQWRVNYSGLQSISTMVPQGLYMKFDITGRDPAGWKLLGVLYNNIYYKSLEKFRKAWEKPGFVKTPKVDLTNFQYAMLNQTGEALPLDLETPPVQFQAQKRWTVDPEAKYVEWMDFSFYMGFNKDVGLTLYDIKYKGERIIYELGLQEALAHYGGADPKAYGTGFLDSYYGFGNNYYELVKGYDCPVSATYLPTTLHENGKTITNKDSLCLFEMDAGYPIQRHTTSRLTQVTKNIVFTLRGVSTIGNYDYTFDYVFHYDGSIEVKVRASGYIQSTYFAHNGDYGYKVENHLSGSMHDHVLTFKADFDIKGTSNSFETTSVVQSKEKFPWHDKKVNTMKLKRKIAKTEKDGEINWAPNGADMFNVINTDKPNKWGEYPGYRIMPGSGTPIHSTVTDSDIMKKTAYFANKHLFVTKYKDNEQRLAHSANSLDAEAPLIDFKKFLNGEKIHKEDIVVWFNVGMHHVPHTGDLPNTVQTTAQSSVVFTPHNYLLGDPTRAVAQMIDIDTRKKGANVIENYGKKAESCVGPIIYEPDYSTLTGSIEVDKMTHEGCSFC